MTLQGGCLLCGGRLRAELPAPPHLGGSGDRGESGATEDCHVGVARLFGGVRHEEVAEPLRGEGFTLADGDLVLRPMTEQDLDSVFLWSDDPENLWFAEHELVQRRTPDRLRASYREISATPAELCIVEVAGIPVGAALLRQMSLPRLHRAFSDRDCRRVDLQLARPWRNQGIGRRAVRLLTAHGFGAGAEFQFGCDISSENHPGLRVFKANRFAAWRRRAHPAGAGWPTTWDLVCRPEYFFGRAPVKDHPGADQVMAADLPTGATVVVYREDPEVLIFMLHRAHQGPAYEGDWARTPPAGARFPAEPIEECACRELSEEIGAEIPPSDLHLVRGGDAEWWVYSLALAPGADVVLDEEDDRFEWLGPGEDLARCRPEAPRNGLAMAISSIRDG